MTDRRTFLRSAAAAGLASLACSPSPPPALRDKHPLIIDALGNIDNINLPAAQRDSAAYDFGIDARALADAKASGLNAFNMTIGYVFGDGDPTKNRWPTSTPGMPDPEKSADLLLVRSAADIKRAKADGRLGVILGFQNAAMMGKDARRVEVFAKGGVRVIQLTYNGPNQLGDGSTVPPTRPDAVRPRRGGGTEPQPHPGGPEPQRRANLLDAAAESKSPIIISHTGCRAVANLPRNKTDKELRLVADKGGFVGIYFMPFLAVGRQPMAADLIAHIEHAINICGEDHVGFGTDGTVPQIDDMAAYMKGLEDEVRQRRAAGISAPGERPDIVPFLPDLVGRTNSGNWQTCWPSVATAAAALKKSSARTSCAWPMAYGANEDEIEVRSTRVAAALAEKPKANVQQERLDKLNGKALGRVIYAAPR
jgi:membrane dipeptidase